MWTMSPPDDLPPTPPTGVDAQDDNAGVPRAALHARPRNRGSQRKKEQGPGNQKHIVNFDRDEDYQHDHPVWKHSSSYPRDTVQVPDLEFKPEPPANDLTGCCSIQWDFSHWTFSTKCSRKNCLSTLLMKRINITMRERIVTDDGVSTNNFIALYFNDVINIFTKQCSAQRPSWGECGYMGLQPGLYSKGTYSLHRVHTSIHLYKNIVKHTLYVHKFVCIWAASASKGMFERNVQFFEGAVHRGLLGVSMGTWARSRVFTQKEHTPCTGFIRQYICTKTLSSAQYMFTNSFAFGQHLPRKACLRETYISTRVQCTEAIPGRTWVLVPAAGLLLKRNILLAQGSYINTFVQKHCQAHNICSQIHLHLGSICLERHV